MAGESLFDLHKQWDDVDPAAELPATLDAHRDHQDGLAHCQRCGGFHFTATVILDDAGQPARMLTPQTCVGCGELRKANWPA